MPLTLAPQEETEIPSLVSRLRNARSWCRFALAVRGAALSLSVAIFAVGLVGYLDWRLHFPPLARAFLLVSVLVGGILVVRRGMLLPLRRIGNLLAVALRIERAHPELNDALVSALQFLEADAKTKTYGSPLLRQDTITRAEECCAEIDFRSGVNLSWSKRWLAIAFSLTLGAFWLAGKAPEPTQIALQRLFMPFEEITWPTKTTIEILSPNPLPARLARGDALELKIAVRGVIPDRVKVTVVLEGGAIQETSYSIAKTEAGSPEATMVIRLDGQRLSRNFRFRVRANDAETPWYAITVQAAPVLVPLDGRPSPQIRLEFPAYTELAPQELTDGTSVIEATAGTAVTFKAATDRPIVRAVFIHQPETAGLSIAAGLAQIGNFDPLGTMATLRLTQEFTAEIPLQLDGDGRTVRGTFIPRLPGAYQLRLEDETGLSGTRLFDFRIQPDPSPQVTLLRPNPSRDTLTLLPNAELTLQALANDKVFGLRSVFLEYRTSRNPSPQRVVMFDAGLLEKVLPALAKLMPLPIAWNWHPHESYPVFALERRIPLERFQHGPGSALVEGDRLWLRVGADDFDTVNPIKLPGYSREVEIVVVGKSNLDAAMQLDLTNIRTELLRLRELEQEARLKVLEVRKQQATGPLKPEDIEKLLQAEQLQTQIRSRIKSAEDGLLVEANRLRQTVRDNKLPKSRTTDRIETLASELNRLANEELEPIEAALAEARKAKPTDNGPLAQAERGQKEVEETFKSLLERLEPWSAAAEVRGEARSILGELTRQLELTRQAREHQKPGQAGVAPDRLPAETVAELDRAAIRPDRLADRTRQLVEKMDRLIAEKQITLSEQLDLLRKKEAEAKQLAEQASQKPNNSPEKNDLNRRALELQEQNEELRRNTDTLKAEIEALRNAAEQANQNTVKQQLQGVGEKIRKNQLEAAAEAQEQGIRQLQQMVDRLEEKNRPEGEDRLSKKRNDANRKVTELVAKQETLQKKSKLAEKLTDPQERRQTLEKLAREQQQLQREAEELAQQLSRVQEDDSAQELRRAARSMEDARQQLERGQPADPKQEDALDRLDTVQDKLDKKQEEVQEELLREKLSKLTELLKTIRDRQQTTLEASEQLGLAVRKANGWANAKSGAVLRTQLNQLLDQQLVLQKELESLVEKRFQTIPVFERMLQQAIAAMTQTVEGLNRRKETALDEVDGIVAYDADRETEAFQRFKNRQKLVIQRLDQLIEALKPDREMMQPNKPDGQEPVPATASKMKEGDGLPPLAQLKALRALQADLAERTAAFDRDFPDRTKLSDDDLLDLKALEQCQLDIAKLIGELQPPATSGESP